MLADVSAGGASDDAGGASSYLAESSFSLSDHHALLVPHATPERIGRNGALGEGTAALRAQLEGRRQHRERNHTEPSSAQAEVERMRTQLVALMDQQQAHASMNGSPSRLGTLPQAGQMSHLRVHVETLSAQLKLAKAKHESDQGLIDQLQRDNSRLQQLADSAAEVTEAASASLRELAKLRSTCEQLRQDNEHLRQRTQDAERQAATAVARASAHEERAALAEQHAADAEQRLAAYEQRSLTSEQRASKAEVQAVALGHRTATVEQRAAAAEQHAQACEQQALIAEQRAAAAERRAAVAEESAAEARQAAADAEQRVQQVEAQALVLSERAATMEASARAVDARAQATRQALERLRADNLELQEQLQLALMQLSEIPNLTLHPKLHRSGRHHTTTYLPDDATSAPSDLGDDASSDAAAMGLGSYLGSLPIQLQAGALAGSSRSPTWQAPGHASWLSRSSDSPMNGTRGAASQRPATPGSTTYTEDLLAQLQAAASGSEYSFSPSALAGRPAASSVAASAASTARRVDSPGPRLPPPLSSRPPPPPSEVPSEATAILVTEYKHACAEIRRLAAAVEDASSQRSAAEARVQRLEAQLKDHEELKAQARKMVAQARDTEQLEADLRSVRGQLAQLEGVLPEMRKAQAQVTEAALLHEQLDSARQQLLEMDRAKAEARRLAGQLQQVTRERDAARDELMGTSAQLCEAAGAKAQLQRAEAVLAEAERARDAARREAAEAVGQRDKLKQGMAAVEEELSEALRRCTKLQAQADELVHQRERLGAALEGAEDALRLAEQDCSDLGATQEQLRSKARELAELQDETTRARARIQELVAQNAALQSELEATQARAAAAEDNAHWLKLQVGHAGSAEQEAAHMRQQLAAAMQQLEVARGELGVAADRLSAQAKLQAELAATTEHADKADAALRQASADAARLGSELQQARGEAAAAQREAEQERNEASEARAHAAAKASRASELEHDVAVLREKAYQLEVEVAAMTTELERRKADMARASAMMEESVVSKGQLAEQLAQARTELARHRNALGALEEQGVAEVQQTKVRLAAVEAELRAAQHANATLMEAAQRDKQQLVALQGQLHATTRERDEHLAGCRRLRAQLDELSEGMGEQQRAKLSDTAQRQELEDGVSRLVAARSALEAELRDATERAGRLQDQVLQLMISNAAITSQLGAATDSARRLEAENARLSDAHATLVVDNEALAMAARAARAEAAELAVDKGRLRAELDEALDALQRMQAQLERNAQQLASHGGGRVTITEGGIPAAWPPLPQGGESEYVSDPGGPSALGHPRLQAEANLRALVAAQPNTGALLAGAGDMSQYEALLLALDEEGSALEGELDSREAANEALLAKMRAARAAVSSRVSGLQAQLQAAREAEGEARREAADRDIMVLKLQQQLKQLAASAGVAGPEVDDGAGGGLGGGPAQLQEDVVIEALRRDLEAAHQRLKDSGGQLADAQHRAERAEQEVLRLQALLQEQSAKVAALEQELGANEKVLGEAEAAIMALMASQEALEARLHEMAQAQAHGPDAGSALSEGGVAREKLASYLNIHPHDVLAASHTQEDMASPLASARSFGAAGVSPGRASRGDALGGAQGSKRYVGMRTSDAESTLSGAPPLLRPRLTSGNDGSAGGATGEGSALFESSPDAPPGSRPPSARARSLQALLQQAPGGGPASPQALAPASGALGAAATVEQQQRQQQQPPHLARPSDGSSSAMLLNVTDGSDGGSGFSDSFLLAGARPADAAGTPQPVQLGGSKSTTSTASSSSAAALVLKTMAGSRMPTIAYSSPPPPSSQAASPGPSAGIASSPHTRTYEPQEGASPPAEPARSTSPGRSMRQAYASASKSANRMSLERLLGEVVQRTASGTPASPPATSPAASMSGPAAVAAGSSSPTRGPAAQQGAGTAGEREGEGEGRADSATSTASPYYLSGLRTMYASAASTTFASAPGSPMPPAAAATAAGATLSSGRMGSPRMQDSLLSAQQQQQGAPGMPVLSLPRRLMVSMPSSALAGASGAGGSPASSVYATPLQSATSIMSGSGGGGPGSPVLSPRVALDSRVLTRVLKPAAAALSGPSSMAQHSSSGGGSDSPRHTGSAAPGAVPYGSTSRGGDSGDGGSPMAWRVDSLSAGVTGSGAQPKPSPLQHASGHSLGVPSTLSFKSLAVGAAHVAGGMPSPSAAAPAVVAGMQRQSSSGSTSARAATSGGAGLAVSQSDARSMSIMQLARRLSEQGQESSGPASPAPLKGSSPRWSGGTPGGGGASRGSQPSGSILGAASASAVGSGTGGQAGGSGGGGGEMKSLLAQRLAAMNEALRALGSTE